ncbi:ketopantoate reductase family protein [Cellulomonas marina]|uniref:2-dehydropantoate 2-reductase/thiosulfate/3-mercaptopyruvate sulfurtransferase n=1 Tax=Cellulomonas marina TaxID=988821 RepID=A0A1I0V346_9CELL|nr:2-dehydropantoate 2-reductase N-terminal domain-containing protein [Cellulomonas marina]GIG28285.1 ketopantoate reductase [Cellulomonas marina]SFA70500.1 2-dehydropantoate 2-reductase/thiosulfate/3-mercaptopyruvate sulfurtransferase [Cellulomonas marina]
MTRYVVIGAGAVGLALAARLHLAEIPVALVARGASLDVVARDGVRYTDPTGTRAVAVPVADRAGTRLAPDDVLVLTVKAQQADDALGEWAWQPVHDPADPHALAADLPVLVLQNGLATEAQALRRFATVLSASILVPAQSLEPGAVAVAAADPAAVLSIGLAPDGTDARVDALVADLQRAGIAAHSTDDVLPWKALKLLGNVNNAVELLGGSDEERKALSRELTAEARTVLEEAGLEPADGAERDEAVGRIRIQPTEGWEPGRASTFQSVARGASSVETDYLNGEIVLLGRLHEVPTPLNAALQRVVGASFARGEAPGTVTVADVRAVAAR